MVQQLRDEGTQAQVLAAGAIAGLVSRFAIAPLDVIKVRFASRSKGTAASNHGQIRLQLQVHSLSDPPSHAHLRGGPVYKGILPTLRAIARDEGVRALWKGNVPAEALYVCYGAAQFLAYRSFSLLLEPASPSGGLSPTARSFAAGAAAGTVATTLTYPLDLLRTRFAAAGRDRVYPGLLAGVREIGRREGARGFFRGLGAANVQIVPYMGLFFAAYEALRPALADSGLPLAWMGAADGAAGMLASVFSKTAVYPLDTVRKRLQVQGPSRALYVHRNIPEYTSGVLGTVKAILLREGVRGMYRVLTVALVKAAPASAVTMWTFERAMATMKYIDSRETA